MDDLRPIRTEADYAAALVEVERLWGAPADSPEGDRLDIPATLIDAYESEHFPMDPPDPIDAIRFRMEQQALSRKDLEGLIGTRTRVAEFWKLCPTCWILFTTTPCCLARRVF
jgi:HTH-type transcriptional regulator/antitoxin HigA